LTNYSETRIESGEIGYYCYLACCHEESFQVNSSVRFELFLTWSSQASLKVRQRIHVVKGKGIDIGVGKALLSIEFSIRGIRAACNLCIIN
jgi:hypothetical protein